MDRVLAFSPGENNSMSPSKPWLIATVVLLVVEILPPAKHFSVLCLSLGALAASIAAVFSPLPWLPWVVFIIVSVALLPVLVPLARFLFRKDSQNGSPTA